MARKKKTVVAADAKIEQLMQQLERARKAREEAAEAGAAEIAARIAGVVEAAAKAALLAEDEQVEGYRPPRGAEARAAREMIAALLREHGVGDDDEGRKDAPAARPVLKAPQPVPQAAAAPRSAAAPREVERPAPVPAATVKDGTADFPGF